ncbi:hypothetical protein AB0C90_34440 [Streptomyces sp. NPDC048550]|uniref:hypothetical protein n=1 Tax=Streptomyces sp. NPDC048550 TaxID=3155739 RepID=UPI00341EAAB4
MARPRRGLWPVKRISIPARWLARVTTSPMDSGQEQLSGLPALLDRHVPLGPDQAARRLGVRRVDLDAAVRLGFLSPIGTVEIDYKHHGGVTVVPLFSAVDVALLPVVRPLVDWQAVATARPGRRSPLAALTPVDPGEDRVLLAEVGRIAGVGRAAAANWRRRYDDFPAPAGGTATSPEFDRAKVVAWLLAHGKIAIPTEAPSAALVVTGAGGGTRRFRLEDPHLLLADDAEDEDRLSGWSTDEDADSLAALSAGTFGLTVKHLATPGAPPLAVLGEAHVIDRFRSGTGGLRLTVTWPAGLRGTAASGPAGGVVRHGIAYAGPGEGCVCRRHDCGGVVPVSWCAEHGGAVGPVLAWPCG